MAYPAQNTAAVSSLSAAASPTGSSSPVRSGDDYGILGPQWVADAERKARRLTGAELAACESERLRREMRRQRAARALPELAPADDTPRHAGLQQGDVLERWMDAEFSDIGRSPRFVAGWWILPVFIGGALVCIGLAYALGRML